MQYKLRFSLTAIAVSALLTACGGGSGGSDTSPPALGSSSSSSSSSGGSSSSSSSSSSSGGTSSSSSSGGSADISMACEQLATDSAVNWRDSAELDTDQKIVECLSKTLGRAVGFGENATGGYDADGSSNLVVIQKSQAKSVEQQIYDAVSSSDYNWIVFDKEDFAQETEVSMHRVYCDRNSVQTAIGGTEQQCINYQDWCSANSVSAEACVAIFFNDKLNVDGLPIGNAEVGSNTTIDGRMASAYFRFNGFEVKGSENVIFTNLDFRGAGHTEDHELDPDMLRNDAAQDIWIHKNSFELTGDSAFDVKQGASGITMSFNRLIDVKRASLHGSSDSRTVNENITTTMHHNAFITTDENFATFSNTGRRVPLIRRGKSHMFNNVFKNYRKDVLSVRVGASVLWEDNAFLMSDSFKSDVALSDMASQLARDIDGGNFHDESSTIWYANDACVLDTASSEEITTENSNVAALAESYSAASGDVIDNEASEAGQDLVDYVLSTAGVGGELPFNAPLANNQAYVRDLDVSVCD